MVTREVPLLIRRSSPAAGKLWQLQFASRNVTSNAGVDPAPVAVKKSRARLWFVGIAGAAGLGALAYPHILTVLTRVVSGPPPPPPPPPPLPSNPSVPPVVAAVVADPPKPEVVSHREELDKRLSILRDELAELRKQEKSKLVNVKKKAIKDEIKLIENGIKKLEKA